MHSFVNETRLQQIQYVTDEEIKKKKGYRSQFGSNSNEITTAKARTEIRQAGSNNKSPSKQTDKQ